MRLLPFISSSFLLLAMGPLMLPGCGAGGAGGAGANDDDDDDKGDDDDDDDDDGGGVGGDDDDDGSAGGDDDGVGGDDDDNEGGGGKDDDDDDDDDDDGGDGDDGDDDNSNDDDDGDDDDDNAEPTNPDAGDPDGPNVTISSLVDDLEDNDGHIIDCGGRTGFWYAYNDGTEGGEQKPDGAESFRPSQGGAESGYHNAATKGKGFKEWGAGIGFDLNFPVSATGEPGKRTTFDASGFEGVAFQARGSGSVRFNLATAAVISEDEGGDCGGKDGDCSNAHGLKIVLKDEWRQYKISFKDIKQEDGWGEKVDFDAKKTMAVLFHVGKSVDFDFAIDDIGFYGGDEDEDCIQSAGLDGGADESFDDMDFLAGFRASRYAFTDGYPEPEYWGSVATQIAEKLDDATPGGIWILGEVATDAQDEEDDGKCKLSFPASGAAIDMVEFHHRDMNHAALSLFDEMGVKVWLQVEPGLADVSKLIDVVLSRYQRHPSVIGFGVDVEFNEVVEPGGEPVSDSTAEAWLDQVQAFNPNYTLMLKHWEADMMPPSVRDGMLFLDDAQGMESMEDLISTFQGWVDAMSGGTTGFQVGYDTDEDWWSEMDDPVAELGAAIREELDSAKAFIWVDFTIYDVFPPDDYASRYRNP
ncbi:MAG: hypothetical protein V3V08_15200 [Nannocystaceae bacterium]